MERNLQINRGSGCPTRVLALTVIGFCISDARAVVIEDWSSGTDAGWTQLDVLQPPLGPPLGGASFSVAGGRYTIASNLPLPALPGQVGAGSIWNNSFADTQYSDGYLRSVLRRNTGHENVALIMRFDGGTGSYYSFNLGGGILSIARVEAFAAVEDTPHLPFDTLVGTDFNCEASALGGALSWKVWPVGQPEPAAPQVLWTNFGLTSGAIGVGVNNFFDEAGPISGTFGAVSFSVPEPTTALLLAPAFFLALARRRRGVSRQSRAPRPTTALHPAAVIN